MRATRKHGCVAATIFISFNAQHRKGTFPKLGSIFKSVGLDGCKYMIGNADIRDVKHPAMRPSRLQQMAGLLSKESNCGARPDRCSQDFSGLTRYAARQINSHHRYVRTVQRINRNGFGPLNIAGEPAPNKASITPPKLTAENSPRFETGPL